MVPLSAETSTGDHVTIYVDDEPVDGLEGQTLVGVMIAAGLWAFRIDTVEGAYRGAFCGMGICFECEVELDGGARTRACMTHVKSGMRVRTASRDPARI